MHRSTHVFNWTRHRTRKANKSWLMSKSWFVLDDRLQVINTWWVIWWDQSLMINLWLNCSFQDEKRKVDAIIWCDATTKAWIFQMMMSCIDVLCWNAKTNIQWASCLFVRQKQSPPGLFRGYVSYGTSRATNVEQKNQERWLYNAEFIDRNDNSRLSLFHYSRIKNSAEQSMIYKKYVHDTDKMNATKIIAVRVLTVQGY
jgi:hypothetical protein